MANVSGRAVRAATREHGRDARDLRTAASRLHSAGPKPKRVSKFMASIGTRAAGVLAGVILLSGCTRATDSVAAPEANGESGGTSSADATGGSSGASGHAELPLDDSGAVSEEAGGAPDAESSEPGEGGAPDLGDGGRSAQSGDAAGETSDAGGHKTPESGVTAAGGRSANQGAGGTPAARAGRGGGGAGGAGSTGGAPAEGGAPSVTAGAGGLATAGTGGVVAAGGASGAAASGGSSGSSGAPCSFSVTSSLSPSIATVGIVSWSTTLPDVTSARVVYTLDGATASTLNAGGTAPAAASEGTGRTLLLGLKPGKSYTFHVEVDGASGQHCASDDYALTTGTLADAPAVTRTVFDASTQAPGFIIAGGGFGSSAPVAIIDADGAVVWTAPAPANTSRARMDYEGGSMWMIAANPSNSGGDLRFVSMDGTTSGSNLSGLANVHHDFAVLAGGAVAVLSWAKSGLDQESDLLERLPDGTVQTLFHVGSNLYAGGQSAFGGGAHSYHANSVAYHATDDSFTIGDRNPSSFVKVGRDGTARWQFGGTCSGAKAPLCVPGSWQVNHGHQLLDDGTFLFFNNTVYGKTSPSSALEFMLQASSSFSASELEHWSGNGAEHSDTLGDVQRLPNGNTLVTFSNDGVIYELDPGWQVVQSLSAASFGYSEWRPTLYGPPSR